MKQQICIFVLIFLINSMLWSQTTSLKSPRNASYSINIVLNADKKQVSGTETVNWKNITTKSTSVMYFHLYMNAFKNNQSTFISEIENKAKLLSKKDQWGWIEIKHIFDSMGNDLIKDMKYVQPDDNNIYDRTVAVLKLARTLRPGSTITLKIEFDTQLPAIFARTGYYKNFFMVAQWFPKLGVFENNGKWNCHQFHRNSEFFSDYGVYDVSVTLPEQFIVEGTGKKLEETKSKGNKKVKFHAEDVHDFAWTASPDFITKQLNYKGTNINLVYEKDHSSSVKRTFTALKHTIDFFQDWVGTYPYENITVLHPPTGAVRAGGMEYPQFITGGTFWNIPSCLRLPEMVVTHEFGHQYWYGIIGSNEFEEAWLDEGINSYFESKIMDTYYGGKTSIADLGWLKVGEISNAREGYIGKTRLNRTLRPSWTYIGGGYSLFSYQKPLLMLRTLENIVGTNVMKTIFRTYFERWKFKHPHTNDFINVVNTVTGKDYSLFFNQFLKNSTELDYKVASVSCNKIKKPEGVFSDSTKAKLGKNENMFRSVVKIYRKGEAVIPVDILIVFNNQDSLKFVWDGQERWKKYSFIRKEKLVFASVDPDNKLLLDSNFTNNSMYVKSKSGHIAFLFFRFFSFYQTLFQLITFIV